MPQTVLLIVSQLERAVQFEALLENIAADDVQFIVLHLHPTDGTFGNYVRSRNIPYYWIKYKSKWDVPAALLKVWKLIRKLKPDCVHAHSFEGGLIGMTAAKWCNIKRRIYTRHYSDFHHVYHPQAIKYDKWINSKATEIIAISAVVANILKEKENVPPDKIKLIPHGFDLERFAFPSPGNCLTMRRKYNPELKYPVIGVISRWIHLKGIQYIIPAFAQILNEYPNALLLLFNAQGDYKPEIEALLHQLPPNSYQTIVFEPDIFHIYSLFDVFVHVPISPTVEAFGQTYVEALAAGVTSVFTISGAAHDFIVSRQNAWVVDYENSDEIYWGIKNLLELQTIRNLIKNQGQADVFSKYGINPYLFAMRNMYLGKPY